MTFDFDGLDGVKLPLIGSYQPRNAAVAITALRVLRGRGWNIPEEAIRRGLETVSWPGRFELLRHTPPFLLDGSHNAHGMRATVQSLKDRFPGEKFVFLVSIMADKDVDEMLALLAPLAKRFVTVAAHTPARCPPRRWPGISVPGAAKPRRLPALKQAWPGPWRWAGMARVCTGNPLLLRRRAHSIQRSQLNAQKEKAMALAGRPSLFCPHGGQQGK